MGGFCNWLSTENLSWYTTQSYVIQVCTFFRFGQHRNKQLPKDLLEETFGQNMYLQNALRALRKAKSDECKKTGESLTKAKVPGNDEDWTVLAMGCLLSCDVHLAEFYAFTVGMTHFAARGKSFKQFSSLEPHLLTINCPNHCHQGTKCPTSNTKMEPQ